MDIPNEEVSLVDLWSCVLLCC